MIEGIILLIAGALLMAVKPVEMAVAHRRIERQRLMPAPLAQAFPLPPRDPELEDLVRCAEEALARDPLIAATANIAAVYNQAAKD